MGIGSDSLVQGRLVFNEVAGHRATLTLKSSGRSNPLLLDGSKTPDKGNESPDDFTSPDSVMNA